MDTQEQILSELARKESDLRKVIKHGPYLPGASTLIITALVYVMGEIEKRKLDTPGR